MTVMKLSAANFPLCNMAKFRLIYEVVEGGFHDRIRDRQTSYRRRLNLAGALDTLRVEHDPPISNKFHSWNFRIIRARGLNQLAENEKNRLPSNSLAGHHRPRIGRRG